MNVVDVVMKIFELTNLCMHSMQITLANIKYVIKKSKKRKSEREWKKKILRYLF